VLAEVLFPGLLKDEDFKGIVGGIFTSDGLGITGNIYIYIYIYLYIYIYIYIYILPYHTKHTLHIITGNMATKIGQVLSSIETANLRADLQRKLGLIHGHRVVVASIPDLGKFSI
jgi:hypothetical protein